MKYIVTVQTESDKFSYTAIGNRDALIDAEYAKHEFCVVSVMRVK